ncbi:MAG: nuclear transport factor 2 family protein [Acidimicrobiia bacterium]|nr:nuclear transport factor 2 family protein [Acidimicrobiia bacterium]
MTTDRVDQLIAYEEIRQLVARYAVAVDSRDIDALVGLFAEDVRVGRDQQGRDALHGYFSRSLKDVGVTILNTGTHLIDLVDTDHATGIVYCRGEVQLGDQWIVQAIQYRDTYERRAGHWYFTRRRHLLWHAREVGTSPLGLAAGSWPEDQIGTFELPEAWPTWGGFWATEPPPPD